MSHYDWEPDELLNFDYSNPVPVERKPAVPSEKKVADLIGESSVEDAIRKEEERNARLREEYERLRAAGRAERERLVESARQAIAESKYNDEIEEIPRNQVTAGSAQAYPDLTAQREEYRKFREQYAEETPSSAKQNRKEEKKAAKTVAKREKLQTKKAGRTADIHKSKFYRFTRVLCIPYIAMLAIFVLAMTIMNVLPFFWAVALYAVLGLLSLILLLQLSKNNVKKWAKVLATTLALVLIVVYGVGTAYAIGTLSFLGGSSVKNENKVASITKEPFNVCMTGMDVLGKIDEPGRSDVNMVVTVNPKTETILMTSIPRDYEIQMPDMDYATDKLTHTGFYSVATTMGAEETLLNTKLNYYVKVNFSTVIRFINSLGGVDVYSEYEFNPVKRPNWTVKEGMNHMTGAQALAFARERKAFLTGDNQRIKNQQAVFEAMIKKATSSKTMVLNYNRILSNLDNYFEMSFSSGEIRNLVKLQLARNPKWKIYKNTVEGGNASMATYTTGSQECYVMSQDPYSIENAQLLIQAVIDGKQLQKDEDGNVTVVEEVTEENTEDAA